MKERIDELRAAASAAKHELETEFSGWYKSEPAVIQTKLREAIYTCTAALIEAMQPKPCRHDRTEVAAIRVDGQPLTYCLDCREYLA